jgi:hypothetical protein
MNKYNRSFPIISVIKAINAIGYSVYHESKTTEGDTVLYIGLDNNVPLSELEKALNRFNTVKNSYKWVSIHKGYSEYAPEITRFYVMIKKGK